MKQRIFGPLGMSSTNTSITLFHPGDNVAAPHSKVEGKLQAIPYTSVDNAAPAGAINSSVTEMSRGVLTQLASGKIPRAEGKRLFSERVGKEMWSAQTVLAVPNTPPGLEALSTNFSAYGLGWGLNELRGHKVVSHTGGVPGYVSLVMMIPDIQLGIVVLTNQEAGGAFTAIGHRIADRYLGAPDTDWVEVYHKLDEKTGAGAAETLAKQSAGRNADSKPSLPLEKYAGRYADPWYGEIGITLEGGVLVLRFSHTPGLVADMRHWQYDTFQARWRNRALDADAANPVASSQGTSGGIIGDQTDPLRRYGRTGFNREHRFVFSSVYNFPQPANRLGFVGKTASGWILAGVITIQSGQYLTLTGSNGNNVFGITNDFAEIAPSCTAANLVTPGSLTKKLNNYFDTSCFAPYPVIGADGRGTGFGNLGSGVVTGPGQQNVNISLSKRTTITESTALEFRSEFFNAFNHPQFANPDTVVTDSTFGAISHTNVNSRIIQFALKFIF